MIIHVHSVLYVHICVVYWVHLIMLLDSYGKEKMRISKMIHYNYIYLAIIYKKFRNFKWPMKFDFVRNKQT